MAILTFSAVVGDARKKIGGVVFTKGHSGAVLRRKTSPVQPRTGAQSAVRANFSAVSKTWADAPPGGVAAWNAYAAQYPVKNKLGQSHTLTGLQMFQRISRNLNSIGDSTPIVGPPLSQLVESPSAATAVFHVTGASATVIPDNMNDANAGYVLSATAPLSTGKTFIGAKYRIIVGSTGLFNSLSGAEMYAAYVAKFGVPPMGKQIGFKLAYVGTVTPNGVGLRGTPVTCSTVTVT